MADSPISQLPPAGPLQGTEVVPVVQFGATVAAPVQYFRSLQAYAVGALPDPSQHAYEPIFVTGSGTGKVLAISTGTAWVWYDGNAVS